jgi:hypothetical protein
MFSRRRSPGFWTFDSPVLSAEFEYFDASIANAIDGLDGGAYSLQSSLVLGGTGGTKFQVTIFSQFDAVVLMNDNLFVEGDATFDGAGTNHIFGGDSLTINSSIVSVGTSGADAFTVNGFTQFNSLAIFNSAIFVNGEASFGDDADFGAHVHFHDGIVTMGASSADAFTVNAFTTLNGTVIANGEIFTEDANFGSSSSNLVIVKARTSLRAPLSMSDTGAIAHRAVAGNNVTTTYSPLAVHEVVMESGVLTGSSDWFIDDTGCVDGQEILFANKDTTHEMTVRRPGGAGIVGLLNEWGRFVRIAGVWQMTQQGDLA